jgi:hypothetical protein
MNLEIVENLLYCKICNLFLLQGQESIRLIILGLQPKSLEAGLDLILNIFSDVSCLGYLIVLVEFEEARED